MLYFNSVGYAHVFVCSPKLLWFGMLGCFVVCCLCDCLFVWVFVCGVWGWLARVLVVCFWCGGYLFIWLLDGCMALLGSV